MYDLTMYVPTRGRPQNASGLDECFDKTVTIDSRLVFILSEDDPALNDYIALNLNAEILIVKPQNRGFVEPLNLGYRADKHQSYAVGFMGDDHRPRTKFWDEMFVNELITMKSGFVYGDDGFQHEAIPTHVGMTSDIPTELGYMTYPRLRHLYADNFWLDLGAALGKIKYLPDVFIEHMHPAAGKNKFDAGYEFSGSFALDLADRSMYQMYLETELQKDKQKLLDMMRRNNKI